MSTQSEVNGRAKTPGDEKTHVAWTRSKEALQRRADFGTRLRELRRKRGLSLQEASALTGVPAATLSRIETSKMSPTLGVIWDIFGGFNISMADILTSTESSERQRVLSVARANETPEIAIAGARTAALHGHFEHPSMSSQLVTIEAQKPGEPEAELTAHSGEELLYVIEGEVLLKLKGLAPVILRPGDSSYFESTVPHVYIALNDREARVLIVHHGKEAKHPIPGPPTSPLQRA